MESTYFSSNLKFLRKRQNHSQQEIADALGMSRTRINSYERNVTPGLDVIIAFADFFKITIDALIRIDIASLSEFHLSELERGFEPDIKGNNLRILSVTVDAEGEERVTLVDQKAQAGYTTGYADPNYMAQLPTMNFPFLPKGGTYRAFQIRGDSMPPVNPGDWIIAEYMENWEDAIQGRNCIVVTQNDGIVFKTIYKNKNNPGLVLVSTNTDYAPYTITFEEVREIWRFKSRIMLF